MGHTFEGCAMFNHKCDKNWQAGSLCTQVSPIKQMLANRFQFESLLYIE